MAWNINAVKTKLEKSLVRTLLLDYDIISLSETKTQLHVNLPGFVTFRRVNSVSSHLERSGCHGEELLSKSRN